MSNNLHSPTVFVVQDPDGKEITLAAKYGKLHVILTGKESTDVALNKLHRVLSEMKPGDYLLPIGKSINMGIAIHFAWHYLKINSLCNPVDLNILVWRREQYEYTVETINL